MKIIIGCCICFCAVATALAQNAVTMLSNLGQSGNASQSFGSSFGTHMSAAVSFRTDNTPGLLTSVSLKMYGGFHPSGGLASCDVSLFNDSGGEPGSHLATLSGNSFPLNAGNYTYTNTSPVTLSSNTTYWVVASSPGSVNNAYYTLGLVTITNTDADSVWSLGANKGRIGSDPWFSSGLFGHMAVAAVPLPPRIFIAAAMGVQTNHVILTYPVPAFPFELQQNSDLVPTGWTGPTNAVAITNNQSIVVTIPIVGQKMFFRLNRP